MGSRPQKSDEQAERSLPAPEAREGRIGNPRYEVVGASIYAWCVWDFATSGRGTPAQLDAPKHLVVRGLYRYTRNPMYVGVLTVIFGCAALYLSPAIAIYGLAVETAFHLVVVFYEERSLAAQFGRQYDEYRSQVARWLPLARRNRPGVDG